MILYVIMAFAGLLLGLLLSRDPEAILLPRLRGLWLLLPIVVLAYLPAILNRQAPELIWTADRQLLLASIGLKQSLIIFLLVINLLPPFKLPRPLWRLSRQLDNRLSLLLASKRGPARPVAQRVEPVKPERLATGWWHRLPIFALLIVVALQTAVLLQNNGYMPLTADYLEQIDNPALLVGIRNGALQLYRLVNENTVLPELALQYRIPWLEGILPNAFPYYGLADLIGSVCLGLCLFTQFIGKKQQKKEKSTVAAQVATQ